SWDVMITIACAFAISKGMINSGMAGFIAEHTIGAVYHLGPHAVLAVLFLITCLFTEVITNNAAAALAFPIALEASKQLGVEPLPFFVTICMAASASFLTPIGYQTNLIVQGIGNYKFSDYLKVGLPLSLIVFIMSVILIPFIWPF
ncbi:MAG: SLC13 family permease, partial [Bacteroidales bacterium]